MAWLEVTKAENRVVCNHIKENDNLIVRRRGFAVTCHNTEQSHLNEVDSACTVCSLTEKPN